MQVKILISLLYIILSLIGITDSSYLTYEKIVGAEVACGTGFDCGEVLNSQWAAIGPIPLSFLGLLFYCTVFLFSILHFLDIHTTVGMKNILKKFHIKNSSNLYFIKPIDIIFILSLCGFIFSLYLVSIMAFIINAWCLFCLISAATSTLLFLISIIYYFRYGHKEALFIRSLFYIIFNNGYAHILKPFLFFFNPSIVHNTMIKQGASLSRFFFFRKCLEVFFSFNHESLEENIDGITFKNKIGLAAGFDYDGDLTQVTPEIGFGFHTIGTVTLLPYNGNASPQLVRLPKSKSILVNKGLKNIGAKKIIKKLEKNNFLIPIGISIASTNKEYHSIREQILDICTCFKLFENSTVQHSYYEMNISCPNTFGGEPFTTPKRLYILIKALSKMNLKKPVFVKMPIDLSNTELITLLNILDKSFIKGVIFGNLFKDKKNAKLDSSEKERALKHKGYLSGKPTFDRSNELISLTRKKFGDRFIIIGTGGVFSPKDAQIKLEHGADLIQLITGMIFTGPQLIGEINFSIYKKR